MEIESSTNLIGLDGLFCTYWSMTSEIILQEDRIEDDFKEGYTDVTPDYYWQHFDNKKFMEDWNSRVQSHVEDILIEMFHDLFEEAIEYKAEGYHSPREYNFSHDVCNFNITISEQAKGKLIKACVENPDFAVFLKEHYTSYDGFLSHTSNNVEEILLDVEANMETTYGAMLSFLLHGVHGYDKDCAYEVFEEMFYSEYVDYTALDEFIESLPTINHYDLGSDWKKDVFKKKISENEKVLKITRDSYRGLSTEECAALVMKDLGLEEDFRELIEEVVGNTYGEIDRQTLKLDL